MNIATVAQMREMDRSAVEDYGIPELVLMENAGQAACFVLADKTGIRGKTVSVFCGSGNNGGDGFVVARKIHSNGGLARVYLLGDRAKIRGVSKTNLAMLNAIGVPVEDAREPSAAAAAVAAADVIVDAILGTGLSNDVRGHYREVIEIINTAACPVMSVDIPSGVNGDTGRIMGCAVRADWTVTFGLPKAGNLLFPGADCCGELFVTHISFPPALTRSAHLKIAVNPNVTLPDRKPDGHKGSFGDGLFIAGATGYFGAPVLAALGFLKAGGGYSRLAAPASMIPFLASAAGEVVFMPQKETPAGSISLVNLPALVDQAGQSDIVVCGPGLSLDADTGELVRQLTRVVDAPMLIDGDGITAVCKDLDCLRSRTAPTILTPHLGEMARITGLSPDAVRKDRIRVLQKAARDLKAIVVLKGAHSLIGYPDGRVTVNLSGNPGMATAGSGDVLAGAIAAMAGLGLGVDDAVGKGVFIHGLAGDLAAECLGEDGMTASDILHYLPAAMKMDRRGLDLPLARRYAGAVVL